jgi:LAO/AO transport system kinase
LNSTNNNQSAQYYIDGILNKNIAILSRAITLVESTHPTHKQLAQQIIDALLPHSGSSFRLGITGVPGVGKSTFIESFGKIVIEKGHYLAVLAIDPSSSKSKGSILGDKTRMEFLSKHENAYIRPSPSSGSLGGVARATHESVLLCEAFGFDYIIIETVGVGQSETAVSEMTDFFLLLMLAGAGDELQGIKRGIMEMADGIAITKADGTNTQKAKSARAEYANAIHLFPPTESGWIPTVTTCSSAEKTGIEDIYDILKKYESHSVITHFFEKKRQQQQLNWLKFSIDEALKQRFYGHTEVQTYLKNWQEQHKHEKINPFKEAQDLLDRYGV